MGKDIDLIVKNTSRTELIGAPPQIVDPSHGTDTTRLHENVSCICMRCTTPHVSSSVQTPTEIHVLGC
jgi:hypothetical protein